GTLLSSQGTDASFVLTLSGFPPGASLRCFQPYQILFPFRFRFRIQFPVAVGGPLPFGCSDFIRDSESEFPVLPGSPTRHRDVPGSRSGGAVNVLERGAPMQIEAPRSASELVGRQTSTTTGRIIGRRR
ncbi:hypothetical protein E2C00_34020, partial [Streptomyces sp. WAC05374]